MNTSQEIATNIKTIARQKNIAIKVMLADLEINVNTISLLSKGREISYISFAKIADYLGVSVDYLLGRTDNPTINNDVINTGDINGNGNVQAVKNGSITISATPDDISSEFMNMFKKLDFSDKLKAMQFVDELKK